MATNIARRIIYALALLLCVLVLNFSMLHLAPGDIADTIAQASGGADEQLINEIRQTYGLDKPFPVQLWNYISKVLLFDLGYSYFYNQPVATLIIERLPATLLLVISAQLLAFVVGVLLGVLSATRPKGLLGYLVNLLALFGYSAPVFWTGILLLITFSLKIPIFPVGGMIDVTIDGGFFARTLDILHHLALPVITLASIFLALYSRLARASMLEVLNLDYIRTARAKGLPRRTIIYKHALKNSLFPVITLAGLQLSAVISGAVLVEIVFSWPGLGQLAFSSIVARDTPTILGILFFSSLVVVLGNLITDFILQLIDPRLRNNIASDI